MDVTNVSTGETVTIISDNTVPLQNGTTQIVDAKFSRVTDLSNPNTNLSSTVTTNQSKVYSWISSGEEVIVVPRGGNARAADFTPGQPIDVAPSVEIHVNTPTGTAVRNYSSQ
jgi:hypothetical protein